MKQKIDWIEKRQLLRREADLTLSYISRPEQAAHPSDVIMHELLVHKVELEMQVQELQRIHMALEESRDRYADYYEFAPLGYLAISRDGLITEINLTGAALLGADRATLINRRLSKFVSSRDKTRWNSLFLSMMQAEPMQRQSCMLELASADGARFNAYVECRYERAMDAVPVLRLALFDCRKIKQAELQLLDVLNGLTPKGLMPELPAA